jgi:hypothetical protein
VQAGVKAKVEPVIHLSAYSEGKLRHFHALYDKWLQLEDGRMPAR